MRKERRGLESERHVVRVRRREEVGRRVERVVRIEEELGGRKVDESEVGALAVGVWRAFNRLRRR